MTPHRIHSHLLLLFVYLGSIAPSSYARSPTPWLFKLLEKPAESAKQEIQDKIDRQTLPFSKSNRLRRNQFLFRSGENGSPIVFVPHDDILLGGNSASYFLPHSGVWAGRIGQSGGSSKTPCYIGLEAGKTNWNLQRIEGFQWDIDCSRKMLLRVTVEDVQGVEWTMNLALKEGYNQLRTALSEFVPQLASPKKQQTNKGEDAPTNGPGTALRLRILYSRVDASGKHIRSFKYGDFRARIDSIKTY